MAKNILILTLVVAASMVVCSRSLAAGPDGYAIGADLSFLKQAESQGIVFKDAGESKAALVIFSEHG